MKELSLSQGKVARISDRQFERANQFKWTAGKFDNKWYAFRKLGLKTILLHRFLMGVTDPKVKIDHRDGDGLNCQDDNLRIATNPQNSWNSAKQSNNTSGYKGVKRRRGRRLFGGKEYYATIHFNGEDIYLGGFDDPIDAAKAYDTAARKYFGEFARTNF